MGGARFHVQTTPPRKFPSKWESVTFPQDAVITVRLSAAHLETIVDALSSHDDVGPADEGWQSDELMAARYALETQILEAAAHE